MIGYFGPCWLKITLSKSRTSDTPHHASMATSNQRAACAEQNAVCVKTHRPVRTINKLREMLLTSTMQLLWLCILLFGSSCKGKSSPVSTSRVDGPSTRPFNSASGNERPSTRPVLTGNGNRSPVSSGR